jgi:hypothetical protein
MPPHVPYGLRGLPTRLWPKCNRLFRLGRHEAQLRCPDEVGGDIDQCNAQVFNLFIYLLLPYMFRVLL